MKKEKRSSKSVQRVKNPSPSVPSFQSRDSNHPPFFKLPSPRVPRFYCLSPILDTTTTISRATFIRDYFSLARQSLSKRAQRAQNTVARAARRVLQKIRERNCSSAARCQRGGRAEGREIQTH